MKLNLSQKIILKHLAGNAGKAALPAAGETIAVKIDQTLTQDATGTLAYLQFESMGFDSVKTKLSASYVDHNTLQTGFENADDHRFLRSLAAKYGIIFSPPGNGICHQLHLENFAVPGETLLGSDSHTPTCGGLGMLAMGAGGLDVACAMAGMPFRLKMPAIVNIELTGKLKNRASAKDVILELLRRFSVKGGTGRIFEYSGPGLKNLDVYQRATIANMGTELGLTSSVFPSDAITREFMAYYGRAKQWKELAADDSAVYSEKVEINLDKIVPMIACPHSPDNVKEVRELRGIKVNQVCIGSCTNSSYRDLMMVASFLREHRIHPDVDLVIFPGSLQVVSILEQSGALKWLISSGARLQEPCCGACIGMGQAPPSAGVSLRTFNRNFKGRTGTADAGAYLCSPEVAVASAIYGCITDPGKLKPAGTAFKAPKKIKPVSNFVYPPSKNKRKEINIIRGPNIAPLPEFTPLPESISGTVLMKLGDNISTDDILPAGAKVLPLRSNIPRISEFAFSRVDPSFVEKAKKSAGIIVAGENYGQGSSREHAAVATRYLGVRLIAAKSFARIHYSNLINSGILPLTFSEPSDYEALSQGDSIQAAVSPGREYLELLLPDKNRTIRLNCLLTPEQQKIVSAGGLLNFIKDRQQTPDKGRHQV